MAKTNVILGEGAFYFNYGEVSEALAGWTNGGGSFAVEKEFRQIEMDGAYGSVKGNARKVKVVPILKFSSIELSTDNLTKFFAGMTSTIETDHVALTESLTIADSDYLTNVAFVGKTAEGKDVVIIVKNALGNGNLEMAFTDKEEVAIEVQYEACYTPDALTTVPYEIRVYTA